MRQRVIVFDLDDTLYKEIDFLISGYREVARHIGHPEATDFMLKRYSEGANAFEDMITKFNLDISIDDLLDIYRNHIPDISLDSNTEDVLEKLYSRGFTLGLITDGRSVTQRNKIKVLRLKRWIKDENILISEEQGFGKPDERCYLYFMTRFPDAEFTYIGDNLAKDFVTANSLGWQTICLIDDGRNIFKQDFTIDRNYLPNRSIKSLTELL